MEKKVFFWEVRKMEAKILLTAMLLLLSTVFAQSDIDQITEPLTKVYDLIKGAVTILGIIAITVAGAMYMFSGANIQSRESAKGMISYAVVGLVLVWVAPMLVNYLTTV